MSERTLEYRIVQLHLEFVRGSNAADGGDRPAEQERAGGKRRAVVLVQRQQPIGRKNCRDGSILIGKGLLVESP